jgi:PBSX family phage terminase large subunit
LNFSDKQKSVWSGTIKQYHRWNISSGATRSGKTYLDYFKIPFRIRRTKGTGLIVLLGNTKATLERNILDPMREIWTKELVGNIGSNNRVRLFGKEVWALGADKASSISKIQGSGIEYCYGDEITTWSEGMFTMLKSRLDKPGACLDGTCNPDNPMHWFYKFLQSDADIAQSHFDIDDNPFNDPRFVAELKKEYAGTVYYDRYIKGLWVAAEGVIYRTFADQPERFIVDTVPTVINDGRAIPDIGIVIIGVDFGGNKSAQAFQATGYSRDFKQIVTLDEYYTKDPLDPQQLQVAFVKFIRTQLDGGYKIAGIYVDSAEQVLRRGLQNALITAGFGYRVDNAIKGPINERIRFYTMLMGCNRYKVLRHCTKTIEAFKTAVWNTKALQDERLDNGTYNIDTLDAQEYSTERYQDQLLKLMMIGR